MAGTGAFCSGQAFCCRPHLTDADHIRVLTKDPLQQEVLVDVQGRIFAGPGEQMDYGIQNVSIFVPLNQIKFAAALLNRDEASVVRDLGQQPCHDGSFAGAGGPGNADGYAIADAGGQKMKHFRCCTAGVQQLLCRNRLLIYDTDGSVDPHLRVNNRRLIHRDTHILIQESDHAGHGIVYDHAAGVEHAPDHINSVLWRGKLVRDFNAAPAGFNHLNVVVGIDVDLLNTGFVDPLFQEGVPGHVLIELLAQFLRGQPLDGVFSLDDVLHHQFFQKGGGAVGISIAGLCNRGGVVFRKIPLYIFQNLFIGKVLIGRRSEENVIEIIHRQFPPQNARFRFHHPLRHGQPAPSAPAHPKLC